MALVGMIDARALGSGAVEGSMSRPVDLVHLARHTLGNRDLEREVLQLFVRQSGVYLDRLRSSATAAACRAAAHTIKGSARGIGAWQVAEAAELVEANVHDDGVEAARLAALQESVDVTNRYIESVLSEL
ncbi:MAG: Hpt domain-containing protein [Hyphomicrobiales bacterium]|nr:MAG: Hpt domain-containing protein [Hyphomicrobiales bacterium]